MYTIYRPPAAFYECLIASHFIVLPRPKKICCITSQIRINIRNSISVKLSIWLINKKLEMESKLACKQYLEGYYLTFCLTPKKVDLYQKNVCMTQDRKNLYSLTKQNFMLILWYILKQLDSQLIRLSNVALPFSQSH